MADLSFLADQNFTVIAFMLFVIFIVLAFKAMKVLTKTVMAAAVAGLFPFFINNVLGLEGVVELSIASTLSFALLGAVLYLIYFAASTTFKISKFGIKLLLIPVTILRKLARLILRPFSSLRREKELEVEKEVEEVPEHKRKKK